MTHIPTLPRLFPRFRRLPSAVVAALADAQNLERLREAEAWEEAARLLRRVVSILQNHGLSSPYLAWQLAIARDNNGDGLAALNAIQDAIALDPACPQFQTSRDIILRRMRATLCSTDPRPEDELMHELHAALESLNELDPECHLATAAWHLDKGRTDDALRLSTALSALCPADSEAWKLHARVLKALNRAEDAAAALARAAALEDDGDLPMPAAAEEGARA